MSTKPTTIASNVTVEFAPMLSIVGKLRTVRSSEKPASFRILCPGCLDEDPNNGVPVKTNLGCEFGHGPYTQDQCTHRGRQEGERMVPLSPEEVAAIKGEDADGKVITVNIHPAGQVRDLNRPTGIVYFFDPGDGKAELIGVMLDLIADRELVFVGELFVKKARRLFLFQAAPHGLELVEMARPEDVFEFEAREYSYSPSSLTMAMTLADALTTDYDPAAYRNGAVERLARVMAAKTDDAPPATVSALPMAPTVNNLEAALAASLAAIEAGKAA